MAILLATVLLGAAPVDEARYFLGAWSCANVAWTFAPLGPYSSWIRNTYGDPQRPDGSAVLGFVPSLQRYVYRDFHSDGSYADLTSLPPVRGRWTWTGPYYRAAGGRPLYGRITYVRVNARRFDRTFETLRKGLFVRKGGDRCLRR